LRTAVIVFRDHSSVFFFYCQRSVRNPLVLSVIAGETSGLRTDHWQ